MTDLLVTVHLAPTNPDLEAVNTFAFKSDVTIDPTVRLDIFNAVAGFYANVPTGGVASVGSYLHSAIDRGSGGVLMRMYDITGHLDGSPHGSPFAEDSFTLPAAAASQNLPTQVSSVLTLRGRGALTEPAEGPGDTRPRARHTGRLILGPFNIGAADNPSGSVSRPLATFRDDALRAAEGLQDNLVDGDYAWCVWSRSDAVMHAITSVEMDNSFDVLRSRKYPPSTRSIRTFIPVPTVVLAA